MSLVATFSGQNNAGLPIQVPKGGATEDNLLDGIATDQSGKLWVFYSSDRAGTYKLFYKTYVLATTTWSSEVEVFPGGEAGTYSSYGAGSSIARVNRSGDIAVLFTLGTNAGNATQRITVIRNNGTKEAMKQVPDATGNITRDLCLANSCNDFTVVDSKSIAQPNIRAIEFSSSALTFGNERLLYDGNVHGTLYSYDMAKGRAAYNPASDQVQLVTQTLLTNVQYLPWRLMYCRDGHAPVFQDVPTNLVASTSMLPLAPQFCCDNIDGDRGYVIYATNSLTAGGELNVPDTIRFREIRFDTFSTEETVYQVAGSAVGGAEANGLYVDGHGNLHAMYRHCTVLVSLGVYMYGASAATIFGFAYRMKRRDLAWESEQEIFFSDARTPGSASYRIYGSGHTDMGARPFPTITRLFAAGNVTDEDGGAVDAEEGVYINYADVLSAAAESEVSVPDCSGVTVEDDDSMPKVFCFDFRRGPT